MAGRIPQNFIDELLSRIDIIDVIDGYVPLKKAGKNHQALCPFHDEKTPSFSVSQHKQFYHCFGCGANGTAISFLMDHAGMGFVEAVEDLASRAGIDVPRDDSDTLPSHDYSEFYELMELVNKYYCQQLREHQQASRVVDYLKHRGISGEIAAKFELGFAPPGWDNLLTHLGKSEAAKQRLSTIGMTLEKEGGGYYDRFRDRITFPIRDLRGRVIGFGGRITDEGTPKYLNSPETPIFHKGRELYGLYQVKHHIKNPERVFVVEGYMDVIALAQYGVNNVVASLGTAVTTEHLEKLFRHTKQIIFTFDGDQAGKQAAWRALETALPLLRDGRQCYFMFMPEGEDPDSFIRKYGDTLFQDISGTTPLSDFLLEKIKQGLDLDAREQRAMLIEKSLPYLDKLPPSPLRKLLIQDIADLAVISGNELEDLVLSKDKSTALKKIRNRASDNKNSKTSPQIRQTISILIQNPQLLERKLFESISSVNTPRTAFICELMELILNKPRINCAGILEHWRDSKYGPVLKELALVELPFSDIESLRKELEDLVTWIVNKQKKETRAQSHNDKSELKRLFPGKTPTQDNKSN